MPEYVDMRVLDFDIETRRVGFHNAGRFAPDGCEPIAIAWKWAGTRAGADCVTLDTEWSEDDAVYMLEEFAKAYNAADMVTGHYITKFDLPILNGVNMEFGLPLLGPKLVSDTKCHLRTSAGLSKSQENLAELLELEESKFHMNDARWRDAARLTLKGLKLAYERVTQDIIQHEAVRAKLIERGLLRRPREWKP